MIRDVTAKNAIFVAPILTNNNFNKLLFNLGKLQHDIEPPLRYTSIIALGKIAKFLPKSSRAEKLLLVTRKALSDKSQPSKIGGLLCIYNNTVLFGIGFIASKLLQLIGPLTICKDKEVKDLAVKCLDKIVKILKNYKDGDFEETEEKKLQNNYIEKISSYVANFFEKKKILQNNNKNHFISNNRKSENNNKNIEFSISKKSENDKKESKNFDFEDKTIFNDNIKKSEKSTKNKNYKDISQIDNLNDEIDNWFNRDEIKNLNDLNDDKTEKMEKEENLIDLND
ncbi:hypothetical protein MHBO_003592, partial [Bonamia ostreae]